MPGSILSAFLDAMEERRERLRLRQREREERATLYWWCGCLIYERRETRWDLQRRGSQVPV